MAHCFSVSFIYARVDGNSTRLLWNKITSINAPNNCPCVLIGDFNAILGAHECVGGRPPHSSSCSDFANMVSTNELQEITTKRAPITWVCLSSKGYMECKLDRALYNS